MILRITAIVGGLGAGLFFAVERAPDFLGPIPGVVSVNTIEGRVTKVRDGDTIEVEGVPIRFGSLACSETGTAAGGRATSEMIRLVSNQSLRCHLNGRMSYDRSIGSCQLDDGTDLGGLMIEGGFCNRYW